MDNTTMDKQLAAEDAMIEQAFQELINDYLKTKHRKKTEIITKAFRFAKQAHQGVRRLSGEPYIMHPISVAKIVCNEIGLGSTSIASALLHDVVEDTEYTVEDIENIFGSKIAQIVNGLTKISGGIFGEKASSMQAENFKKLLLTMSDDIRVILIKIADRLHNMRTLGAQPANKRYKIAGETLYLYAPIASRLGLNKIKSELENLSFKYEHPEEYQEIMNKLAATTKERDELFYSFTRPIRERLDQLGFEYEIKARIKSPYSIWMKMQSKHISFEDIYDILAVRIIFTPKSMDDELNNCFDIYIAISKIYKPHPDRLRDWVSHPKPNGYQALHVTLMGPQGNWVEVQIRSKRMDDVAEQGFTAHWKYKEGGGSEDEGELDKWLHTIKEILEDPQPDAMDFLDTIKLNLYTSEIFVFTPKGDIKTIPQGSTVLDFAFLLHSQLGSNCIGAKVNHKLVPLTYKLSSGDQVEILTAKNIRITRDWLDIITTAKAKTVITSYLRKEEQKQREVGLNLLREFFEKEAIEENNQNIQKLCRLHSCSDKEQLMLEVGSGRVKLGEDDKNAIKGKQNWMKYFKIPFVGGGSTDVEADSAAEGEQQEQPEKIDKKQTLKLTPDKLKKKYVIARCCNPIPGDEVLGYLDESGKVVIHKVQCPIANKLKAGFGNRIITTEWDTGKQLSFTVPIKIEGIDDFGLLNKITEVISHELEVNIKKMEIESEDGIFEGTIYLYVHNVDDVKTICNNLRRLENIKTVTRLEK